MTEYVGRCSGHMAEDEAKPEDIHRLGWCRQCHQRVYVAVDRG